MKEQPEPLVYSSSQLFCLEVNPELLPPDDEYIENSIRLAMGVIRRRAASNAWKLTQVDPIYLGM